MSDWPNDPRTYAGDRLTAGVVALPRRSHVPELLELLGRYLHLDDTGHVWFTLADAVSVAFDDEPLWGMVVGASSGGKTEDIRLLDDVAVHTDELTGPAALLSWTKGKQPRPTGLLTRLGDGCNAMLTVGDFSTVLAMSDRGRRDQLFAQLRRVYDGATSRDVGNAPGQLAWHGRLTLLAGCTSAIDRYSAHADALGPRWLYYRLRPQPASGKATVSGTRRLAVQELAECRAKAQELAAGIVEAAREVVHQVVMPEPVGLELDRVAVVACYGRGAVPRNGYGRREIEGLPEIEEPPRLIWQLVMLWRSLVALGLDQEQATALCRRAALDSMPEIRRRILDVLVSGERLTAAEVAREVGAHRHVARMALEDLAAVDLVDGVDRDDDDPDIRAPRPWWLSSQDPDLRQLTPQVLRAPRWSGGGTKSSPTPPHPPEVGGEKRT
jgi:hypothetical protein